MLPSRVPFPQTNPFPAKPPFHSIGTSRWLPAWDSAAKPSPTFARSSIPRSGRPPTASQPSRFGSHPDYKGRWDEPRYPPQLDRSKARKGISTPCASFDQLTRSKRSIASIKANPFTLPQCAPTPSTARVWPNRIDERPADRIGEHRLSCATPPSTFVPFLGGEFPIVRRAHARFSREPV